MSKFKITCDGINKRTFDDLGRAITELCRIYKNGIPEYNVYRLQKSTGAVLATADNEKIEFTMEYMDKLDKII
jgi:hypothetical protein